MLLLGRKGGGSPQQSPGAPATTAETEKPDSLRRYQPDQVRGSAVVRTLSVQTGGSDAPLSFGADPTPTRGHRRARRSTVVPDPVPHLRRFPMSDEQNAQSVVGRLVVTGIALGAAFAVQRAFDHVWESRT